MDEERVSRSLRGLPSVDSVASALAAELQGYGREAIVEAAREELAETRRRLREGAAAPSRADLLSAVQRRVEAMWGPTLVPVINATGVVLHTNLGRAPLSPEAAAAMAAAAAGYSNLEYDLEAGERGSRHVHASGLLARLTGAEAALVVNNNAAAVYFILSVFAAGNEVIVSRGQAVEIGGGFRIPDVLRQSGARLVEVGTTNRTYAADYEAAIGPDTALLLRVHTSNFKVVGFVHAVDVAELAELGRRHGVPVIDDLGSGSLLDTTAYGLAKEPTPQESVAAGVALACFSGDKLLGGPQAGLIVGKTEFVERLRRHPMARALRVDKMTLAGLQTTLLHYARGEAVAKIPVWRMIAAPVEGLEQRAQAWAAAVRGWGVACSVVESTAAVGGGSLPGETLPSRALAVEAADANARGFSLDALARCLRAAKRPVVARIEQDRILFDARTVLPNEDEALLGALRFSLGR